MEFYLFHLVRFSCLLSSNDQYRLTYKRKKNTFRSIYHEGLILKIEKENSKVEKKSRVLMSGRGPKGLKHPGRLLDVGRGP